MKLLILTQKVSRKDDILGFFHGWLLGFSQKVENLVVVCLEKGEYELPENARVFSLGKERGSSKAERIKLFYKYIWNERKNYDKVFVHMNPEYVVLGGIFWRLLGKRISLWYTHKAVHWKLRVATFLAHSIFTVSGKSFNLKTKKLKVVGHGIDIDKFVCSERANNIKYKIISVGRVSKIKDPQTLIEATEILNQKRPGAFVVEWFGLPSDKKNDIQYFEELKTLISEKGLEDVFIFKGSVSNSEIVSEYCKADLTVNLCPTGGVDKAVLESMSCGVPSVVANEAFREDFGEYYNKLIFKHSEPHDLAHKIGNLMDNEPEELRNFLRSRVVQRHDLKNLIDKLVKEI